MKKEKIILGSIWADAPGEPRANLYVDKNLDVYLEGFEHEGRIESLSNLSPELAQAQAAREYSCECWGFEYPEEGA